MFKHLKYQNLSTGDDFIHTRQIIVLVPFLVTKEALSLLTNYPTTVDKIIIIGRILVFEVSK